MLRLTSHDGQSPVQNQPEGKSKPGLTIWELLIAWRSILRGYAPMLSIEITRECPLSCPGCYAYGQHHLEVALLFDSLAISGATGLWKVLSVWFVYTNRFMFRC